MYDVSTGHFLYILFNHFLIFFLYFIKLSPVFHSSAFSFQKKKFSLFKTFILFTLFINMNIPTQEEIDALQKASLVSNTERNTSKWLRVVDHFNKSCGISQSIEQIDSLENLENYLCQFITWLKKEDGIDYKVESIHNCYSALNRYLKEHSILQPIKIWDHYRFPRALRTLDKKMRILQSKGLGDPKKSDGLSAKEIKQILDSPYMNINSNE